ncbi:MAG TPA: ferrous iron transport protein B, partial [Opitutae bacterium]|nr:ferrous iron transport protein B [Opitutae bacterium]
ILCIIDASNLERNLYLASQIIELGLPVIAVLNMADSAKAQGNTIDKAKLAEALGVPIVETCAHKGTGILELRLMMSRPVMLPAKSVFTQTEQGDSVLDNVYSTVSETLAKGSKHNFFGKPLEVAQEKLEQRIEARRETLIEARYKIIQKLCEAVVLKAGTASKKTLTDRLDGFFLHPVLGGLSLLCVLGLLFYSIFALAETPMNWVEGLINHLGTLTASLLPAGQLADLIVNGVIAGVGSVLVFLPQIAMLLLFIGLLESTGYMARAAFLLDRVMNRVGLPGKAFIPLLSSYACAIPGIMATRTIECPKDRLATILVAPFASCSARLPVFLVMIATISAGAEAPASTKAGLLLLMYILGTVGALGFAWFFKKTLLRGGVSSSVMELPPYRIPSLMPILNEVIHRSKLFLRRAGTIILGISILMWFFLNYPRQEEGTPPTMQLEHSIAGHIGKSIEPIMEPLGYDWKTSIAILASFVAREVFVSTVAIIYNVEGEEDEPETHTLAEALKDQKHPDGSFAFSPLRCLSLMVFYVFAMQCLSTLAIVRRETNSWRWPFFQFTYMTALAYIAALIVYQGGHFLGFV